MVHGKFSKFCHEHDNMSRECNDFNTDYKTTCLEADLKKPVSKTSCDEVHECAEKRSNFKNKCYPFTEDNGHFIARENTRKYMDKCRAEFGQDSYKTFGASVRTFFEPTVIDRFNDAYQYNLENKHLFKKKKGGGASRRKSLSKRRQRKSHFRRATRSRRRRTTSRY